MVLEGTGLRVMPVDYDNLDDGYVADLLKRDASSSSVGYSASGLYTFLPKRYVLSPVAYFRYA